MFPTLCVMTISTVCKDYYLKISQRRYMSIGGPAKHVTRKKIASEQGTVEERKTCTCMVVHDTNTCTFILCRELEHVLVHLLYKDTWVEEALCRPLLYSEVHYVALLVWRVVQVDQRQLFVLYAWENARRPSSSDLHTFNTPKWKSPWPAAPSEAVGFWSTSVTADSLASFEE